MGCSLAIKSRIRNSASVLYDLEIGAKKLQAIPKGQYLNVFFRLNKEYFIVYPKNTHIVGQVNNPILVNSIVTTYNLANFLIEIYLINNEYLDRRMRGPAFGVSDSELLNQTQLLKETDLKLKQATQTLLEGIDNYRRLNPVPVIEI